MKSTENLRGKAMNTERTGRNPNADLFYGIARTYGCWTTWRSAAGAGPGDAASRGKGWCGSSSAAGAGLGAAAPAAGRSGSAQAPRPPPPGNQATTPSVQPRAPPPHYVARPPQKRPGPVQTQAPPLQNVGAGGASGPPRRQWGDDGYDAYGDGQHSGSSSTGGGCGYVWQSDFKHVVVI